MYDKWQSVSRGRTHQATNRILSSNQTANPASRFGAVNVAAGRFGAGGGSRSTNLRRQVAANPNTGTQFGVGVLTAELADPHEDENNRFYIGFHEIVGGGGPIPNHPSGAPRQVLNSTGKGSLADPEIVYTVQSHPYDPVTEENTLRAAAKAAGAKCLVLRAQTHDRCYAYEKHTRRQATYIDQTTGQRKIYTVPADWHYSVWMGDSRNNLQLQGHIFVYPYGHGNGRGLTPIRTPGDRQEPRSNLRKDKDYYEYWRGFGSHMQLKRGVSPQDLDRIGGQPYSSVTIRLNRR